MMKRFGLTLSLAAHGGLLVWALLLLAAPRPFDSAPDDAIAVDLVAAKEIAPPVPTPPPERPAEADFPAQRPEPAALPVGTAQIAPPGVLSMFDPAGTLALYNMRLPRGDFDARADTKANLTHDEIAAFKSHVRKCWRLPDGLAPASTTRVLLRVFLNADGALKAEPMLVEASASREGPAVMQAAMQALTECQPFTFLPRERYSEWKVLDVSFSPREMAGG